MTSTSQSQVHLPRVEIKFCVKCKWNLRAAYYAQELLQTFCSPPSEITLGEIALVPVEGGIFTVTLYHTAPTATSDPPSLESTDHNKEENSVPSTHEKPHQNSLHNAGHGPTPLVDLNPSSHAHSTTVIAPAADSPTVAVTATQVWDRKADGGFPETKELKNRIRNLVDPSRRMGHIDRSLEKGKVAAAPAASGEKGKAEAKSETTDVKPAAKQQQGHLHDGTGAEQQQVAMEDCEDCRLAAVERLEGEIGDVKKEF